MAFKVLNVKLASPIDVDLLRCFNQKVVPRLQRCDQLNLYIDSHGGQVTAALTLARFLLSLKDNIRTYNLHSCDSAAVVVFAAGAERVVNKSIGTFLLHEVGKELHGLYTISTLSYEMNELENDTNSIVKFLEQRTGRHRKLWKQDMKKGRTLSDITALRFHLATDRVDKIERDAPKAMICL